MSSWTAAILAERPCAGAVVATAPHRPGDRARDRVQQVLTGNHLGDPTTRPLWVYTPPGYGSSEDRYPSVYVIQGYCGQAVMWWNRTPFREGFPAAIDRTFASGQARPCIVVYVDAWTAYGGSQFVDSRGTGRYHTYLCDEVVPFVDEHYRTMEGAAHRGFMGKSSGGFGAMITPPRCARIFSEAWPRTPAMGCTNAPTCPNSPRPCAISASTMAISSPGGRTFRRVPPSPRRGIASW